jgi:anti-sigma B factor antagonist
MSWRASSDQQAAVFIGLRGRLRRGSLALMRRRIRGRRSARLLLQVLGDFFETWDCERLHSRVSQSDRRIGVTCMVGFSSRTVISNGSSAVAYLQGELDACSVTCLKERLTPVAMTGRDIIVDLAGLSFIDTAGLIALVDLQRDATSAGGSLRLAEPSRMVRRLLRLAGIKDMFAVVGHAHSR